MTSSEIPMGPSVTCSVYQVDDERIDLLVHPDDAVDVRLAVDHHPVGYVFRVIASESIVPGRMVAVDKVGLLGGLDGLTTPAPIPMPDAALVDDQRQR